MLMRLSRRMRGSRTYRESSYPYPDLSRSGQMSWPVRIRMFFTGNGAVGNRDDLRGRWVMHRRLRLLVFAIFLAWFFWNAAEGWTFFDG